MAFDKHPGPWRARDYNPRTATEEDIADLTTCEMKGGDVIVHRIVDANGVIVIDLANDGTGVCFADMAILDSVLALGGK